MKKLISVCMLAACLNGSVALAAESYKVGSTPTGMPFTYLDAKSGKIAGVMVDVIDAVSKKADFTYEISPMVFSALIGSLQSKRIDIISAAMLKTDERARVIDFTNTIFSYGEGLVVPDSDKTQYTELEQLKGKTVGIQIGTSYIAPAQKAGLTDIKLYEASTDMMRDLVQGRVQAVLVDQPIAAAYLSNNMFKNVHLVESYKPVVVRGLGLITRKGDTELQQKLNAAIDALKADGTVASILKKWKLEQ
ncbi:amino acid ABC transporter substrate-binding protein [Advenella sp. S44]|uniref:ABC transporter substrate-binding protein n=1 Tax=Advenella sp. S44 TaxID=1982755 RepID=UPI000C29B8D6|nr:ABC transporter substrate-binding protein [Advenella sp. S44]PJX26637.1 amino acid ABC transporter substrate-binding protein [Advenella sp. S44]